MRTVLHVALQLVDDAKTIPGGGSRSYGDFARLSPIPARGDGATHTPRNSPPLVNASLARDRPFFLHFDGEFPSAVALVQRALRECLPGRDVAGGAAAGCRARRL